MSANDTASSVSKGVFAYKGKKLAANPLDYVGSSAVRDGDSDRLARIHLFDDLWGKVNSQIQLLQMELNTKVFDELLSYVRDAHRHSPAETQSNRPQFQVGEIPTAALVTGVNVPDHAAMFANLKSLLCDRVTHHVVSLRSSFCHTVKSTVVSTVTQLVSTYRLADDDIREDAPHQTVNKSSCSMSDIVSWYNSLYQRREDRSCKLLFKKTAATPVVALCPLDVRQTVPFVCTSPAKHSTLPKSPVSSPLKLRNAVDSSPRKCPLSPAPNRAGLRSSGTTPKKLEAFTAVESPDRIKSPTRRTSPEARASPASRKISARKELLAWRESPMKKETCTGQDWSVKSPIKRGSPDAPGSPACKKVSMRKELLEWKESQMKKETCAGKEWSDNKAPWQVNFCAKKSADRPPIVILLEDFEGFDGRVLQDFITICGYHLHEIPLVLIFGIATTIDVVHRLLPHQVTSLLSMEKFQAPLSSEYLSLVLNRILLNHNFPFKLGDKVFDFLLDLFLFHDFSVLGFISAFQLAMMEHFYSNLASILCRPFFTAERDVTQLSASQLESIRSCASFKHYVEGRPGSEQSKLLKDDKFTKREVLKMLSALNNYHVCFYPVLAVLHTMTSKLPGNPLGKQLREVYAMCLSENIFDLAEYSQTFSLLRTLSRDELVRLLSLAACHLEPNDVPTELKDVHTQIAEFREKFENIADLSLCPDDTEGVDSPTDCLPKKTNMYALRQKLQELDKQKKDRKLTVYEKLRNELVDYLDATFRKYLPNPSTFPLHEVMYFSAVNELKQHICAAPRAAIQRALNHPYLYLKNEALNIDSDGQSADLPDICIAYKLHMECGRLINLYDWLQAFASIVQSKDDAAADDGKPLSEVVQARFIRAVSELQFLGFIKPTKRKTDHVARLTWGPC